MTLASTTPFSFTLKSESTIYQYQAECLVNENELNLSLNPSMMNCSGSIKANVSGSDFQPYATTVGLYNAANELLVVAKTGKPFPIPANTDITFIVRYDG
jgi:hypothetical protein